MSNGTAPRIARWLAREVFGDARPDIIGLRVLEGSQTLTDVTIQAGDEATSLAEEISETLATYFNGDKRGQTFNVAPVWREGATPRVGKLAVRVTPSDVEANALAAPVGTSLAALSQAAQANPNPGEASNSWRDQARFNASQVGLLTSTLVNLARAGAEQHASLFDTLNGALSTMQKAHTDLAGENERLRRELSETRRLLEESQDIARVAVKQVEELNTKLRDANDGNRLMQPIVKELTDKVSGALGGIVIGSVTGQSPQVNGHQVNGHQAEAPKGHGDA